MEERIIVSTSAFGMGLDVSDDSLAVCFGCPSSGLEFVQHTGRGGRQADVRKCHLTWKGSEKKLDQSMLLLVRGNCCITKWILRDLLESDEFTTDIAALYAGDVNLQVFLH